MTGAERIAAEKEKTVSDRQPSMLDALADVARQSEPVRGESGSYRLATAYHQEEDQRRAKGLKTRIGKSMSRCAEILGQLEHGQALHAVSAGEWSCEHAIAHLLDQTGPADVHITTWTCNQESALLLRRAVDAGVIRSLRAVFDFRFKLRHPDAAAILIDALGRKADLRLTHTHAKVYLIGNEEWAVTMESSANLSTNTRIEHYSVTEDRGLYDFHRTWMDAELDRADPFDFKSLPRGKRAMIDR